MLWGVREQVAQIFNTMETSKRAHGIVEWGITQVRPPSLSISLHSHVVTTPRSLIRTGACV